MVRIDGQTSIQNEMRAGTCKKHECIMDGLPTQVYVILIEKVRSMIDKGILLYKIELPLPNVECYSEALAHTFFTLTQFIDKIFYQLRTHFRRRPVHCTLEHLQ